MINSGAKKITVLLPSNEAEQIKHCAAASGLTQNEWVRRALIKASGAMNNRKDDRQLMECNIVYSKMIIELLIHKNYPPNKRGASFANLWNFAVKGLNARGLTRFKLMDIPAQSTQSTAVQPTMPNREKLPADLKKNEDEELVPSMFGNQKFTPIKEKKSEPEAPPQTQEKTMDPALWHHIQKLNNDRGL